MDNIIDLRLPVTTRGDQYSGILERGQWVHSILYGGRDGIIHAIAGIQTPETIRHLGGVSIGGSAYFEIVFKNGTKANVPEPILRGVQWFISDCFASEEEIKQALELAEATRLKKEEEEKQKAMRRQNERERIATEYSFLKKQEGNLPSWVLGAKNIKAELNWAFPGVPFSVTSKSYTGGCSIEVSWNYGPTIKQVENITNKYQEGHFDGMNDIYEYDRENVWPSVFGGAKYIFTYRSFEEDTEKILVRDLCALTKNMYDDERWNCIQLQGHNSYAVNIVRNILNRTEIPLSHIVTGLERTDCTCGSLEDFYRVVIKPKNQTEDSHCLKHFEKSA